jgi:hypothetical protein
LYILEFAGGVRASSWDDVWSGPAREGSAADIGIRWRVEGTEGIARGTIGWPGYPERVPSTIDYSTIQRQRRMELTALGQCLVSGRVYRSYGRIDVRVGAESKANNRRSG